MLAVIRSRNIFRNRILNEIKNSVVHNRTALENHIGRRSHDTCTSGYRKAVVSCMFRGSIGAACTIKQSKEYQAIKKLPKTINGKHNPERTEAFKALNKKEGFTDYAIQHYATGIRNSWMEEHIHAHIAQKLATRAFKAVQKIAFGTAKRVRFKGKNQMDSLEGKNNETGLIFKNNAFYWSGLEIPCI